MANGYRITESSDFRVTEDGASRLTEGFNIVELTLSATGSVVSNGGLTTGGTASLSGAGSTLNVGLGTLDGEASLTASGSIVSAVIVTQLGTSALSGAGTFTSEGRRIRYGVAPLSGAGSSISAGLKTLFGVFESGSETLTRITEDGNTRVTEAGDTRTGNDIFGNVGLGTIVALPSKTFFSSEPYYNDDGTWKDFIPYVKWNGSWTGNIKIYKHTNGAWKRSY